MPTGRRKKGPNCHSNKERGKKSDKSRQVKAKVKLKKSQKNSRSHKSRGGRKESPRNQKKIEGVSEGRALSQMGIQKGGKLQ